MGILKKLHKDMMLSKKGEDKVLKALLPVLYSEASIIGKNARNGETTDEECLVYFKKTLDKTKENITLRKADDPQIEILKREIEIISSMLPTQIDDDTLTQTIKSIIDKHGLSGMKGMKTIMAELSANFSGQYDGTKASAIAKSLLT